MAAERFTKILIPVDFSPASEAAFGVATDFARLFSAELLLLHVVDTKSLNALNRLGLADPGSENRQKKRLRHHARLNARRLLESPEAKGLSIRRILAEGAPFVEIAKTARVEQVDLVVIGTYGGRAGSIDKIFFGSTAEKVVRTAGCAVLTVPPPVKAPRSKVL